MSSSLVIKIQIWARHRPLRWPFLKVCNVWQIQCCMISACNADLPFCNSEFKGDCKVGHIVKSHKGAQREVSYIRYIFCFQKTGNDFFFFFGGGFGMTVSKRCASGWYVFSSVSHSGNTGHTLFIQGWTEMSFYKHANKSDFKEKWNK